MKFSSALITLTTALLAPASAQTIVDVAVGTGSHNTLVDLVTQAELVALLSGDGPFTVFAPTDAAFDALPTSAGKFTTPDWHAHLTDILTYHVVPGAAVMSGDLSLDQMVTMANGGTATITSLTPPMINEANIATVDVGATNGVVHVVDGVLLPTSATSSIVDIVTSPAGAGFSTLVAAVTAADLVDTLGSEGPFTVFAPTDDAFAAVDAAVLEYLLTPEGKDDLINVLTYHVFAGVVYQSDVPDATITMVNNDEAAVTSSPLTIQSANILEGQILASNGVIHAIDSVILPPSLDLPEMAPAPAPVPSPAPEMDSGATTIGSMVALSVAAVAFLLV